MRNLKKNETKLWYSNYGKGNPILDENGDETGDYDSGYGSREYVIPFETISWQIIEPIRLFSNTIIPSKTVQIVINFAQLFCSKAV